MRYLGLDLGSKTLGIAISDQTETIATTFTTLYFKNEDYDSIIEPLKTIILDNEIDKIVLGFPKNMDNTIGKRASIAIDFKKKIEKQLQKEVLLQD